MLTAACNHSPASLKNRNHKQGGGGEAAKDTKDRKACRELGGGGRDERQKRKQELEIEELYFEHFLTVVNWKKKLRLR